MTVAQSPTTMDSDGDQDESVRIAASALDDMRNGAQQQPNDSAQAVTTATSREGFATRMTGIPLVNSALRVYEQGKASSRVVKYGAQMVESGVRTISKPVINRLPVDVGQLDDFACRQLDRLDRYRRPSISENPTSPPPTSPSTTSTSAPFISSPPSSPQTSTTRDRSINSKGKLQKADEGPPPPTAKENPNHRGASCLTARSPFTGPEPPPPPDEKDDSKDTRDPAHVSEDRQVVQRSRWQTMLLEAGGLSAALSDESMRRLKYCLEWLHFATTHIDGQILILRDFIASLQPLPPDQQQHGHRANGRVGVSQQHLKTLTAARRDIVHTIRQVVDVVSRYAGGALPEPARTHVRGFILQLPQRWAKKARSGPGGGEEDVELERVGGGGEKEIGKERERERESVAAAATGGGAVRRGGRRGGQHRERGAGAGVMSNSPSRASSPMGRHSRHHSGHGEGENGGSVQGGNGGGGANGEAVSANTAILAAQKILTLATESLDMMRGVTGVVKDSLDRADAWVGRFRAVGIERRNSGPGSTAGSAPESGEREPMSPTSPTSPESPYFSHSTAYQTHRQALGQGLTRHARTSSDLSELSEPELLGGRGAGMYRRSGGSGRAGSVDCDNMDFSRGVGGGPTFLATSASTSYESLSTTSMGTTGSSASVSVSGGSVPGTPGSYGGMYGGYGGGRGRGMYVHVPAAVVLPLNVSSPGLGLGFGSMTLDSRGGSVASTPRSVTRELEEDLLVEDDDRVGVVDAKREDWERKNLKIGVGVGDLGPKVVGMDVQVDDGDGRMDVDV